MQEHHTEQRKPMTVQQRKAMHKYCRDLAKALDEAGYMAVAKPGTRDIGDGRQQFPWKEGIDVSFSMEIVKENIWKTVLAAMEGKDSTEDQNTVNVMEVYEQINRHMGEKFGIHVPWPSEETLSEEQRNER